MTRFRPVTEIDLPIVAEIIREAYVQPAKRFAVTRDTCPVHPAHYTLQSLRRDIAAGRRCYVLEDTEEDVVGCVCMRTVGQEVEISRLAVEPTLQGRGYGSALLDAAMKLAEAEQATAANLFLFAQSPELLKWFRQRGFVRTDTFEVNDVPAPLSRMVRVLKGSTPPEIRMLVPGDEPSLEQLLLSRLDSSAMLLSNLRNGGIVNEGKPRQATYLGAFRDGKLVGVVALCWNGMLLLQAPEMLDQLARTIAATTNRGIEGIVASADQAQRVTQVLSLPTGKHPQVMMDSYEYLYGLDLDQLRVPEPLADGMYRCRRVQARDVPVLTDWMVEYELESLNRRMSRSQVEAGLVQVAEEHDNRWILEGSDGLLSTTGFNAATAEVAQVGGVYTPPALRARKYARCAVAASLLEARGKGVKRSVLFTAHENIPAQRAYEAIGYKRVGEFRLLMFKSPIEPRLIVPAF
jgi:predicted GNAT family acetyltransferase